MKNQVIQSFDKTVSCNTRLEKPGSFSELQTKIESPVIAKGAGMSYCSATALENGLSIDMGAFNKIISFDEANGYITVEAGICIGEVNNFVINRGWQMPVLPGYPMITVGGCIAFNVHGKSTFKIGLFQNWVEELKLYHPAKGELICSPVSHADVFNLTLGGMGFTGIILSAKLRLKKIAGNTMQIKTVKAATIEEAVRIMTDNSNDYEYVYSWNNFNLSGQSFGKGIVYLEKIKEGFNEKYRPVHFSNRLLPHKNTPAILNSFTIYWMCQVYSVMNSIKPSISEQNLSASSFPIYGKEIYYHLFGKKGFREYQVIFPVTEWPAAMAKIEKLVKDFKMGIALASLKLFKSKPHYISFSGEGVCLAIDIPNNKKSIEFFNKLDEVTFAHNGIINLSKDSRAGYDLVSKTFAGYNDFKKGINEYDPQRVFVSELRNRIKI